MKNIIISILILILISASTGFAQQTFIRGNAKTYAKDTLKLLAYRDMITKKKIVIATAKVEESGDFVFSFSIQKTMMCMMDLNVFAGLIFVEPGKEYLVVLPKKMVKTEEDRYNPYFKVEEFYMTPLDIVALELNKSIRRLDYYCDKSLDMLYRNYRGVISPTKTNRVLEAINDSFPGIENAYFEEYKSYQYAVIKYMTYFRNKNVLVKKYFSDLPVLYNSPAYEYAFEKIIDNYFDEIADKDVKKEFYNAIKHKESWTRINEIAKEDSLLKQEPFREYVILKSLYKNFYTDDFMKREIIEVMNSASIESEYSLHREIARDFVGKSGKLLVGNIAPELNLRNKENDTLILNDFAGKFIYLNFFQYKNSACEKEIGAVEALYLRKIDLMEVVTVWTGGSYDDMLKFISENQFSWTFLYAPEDDRILKDYNIRAYPTYYMIHPEGTLSMKPAPSPLQEIEARYSQVYGRWKRELVRRENNNNTIKND